MARRGNGEGSVYRRQDGRWAGTISLGYENGKQRRKTFYGHTRGEVAAKLTAAIQARQHGLPVPGERLTVGDYLERWLKDSKALTLRPRTFASYRMIVRQHLNPAFGRVPLTRLRPDAIQAYLNQKLESGRSALTVRNHHAVLRSALTQAEQWGLVPRNAARLVKPPRNAAKEIHPLSPEQAKIFLESIQDHRLYGLFSVALALGMRQGEILGLSWDDVDLDTRKLKVWRQLQRYDGAYHLDEHKTDRSRRSIPLPPPLVDALRGHRIRQFEERLRAGPTWVGGEWNLVFATPIGAPTSGSWLNHHYQVMLERAGLPRGPFHTSRHAAASFMLAQGVQMRVVMEILGHSSITVTSDLYSHVMPELERDATALVGKLLWPNS